MDSLQNLIGNIPDWDARLDDFSGQIEKRQRDLAAQGQSPAPVSSRTRSARRGSTESLRRQDSAQDTAVSPTTQAPGDTPSPPGPPSQGPSPATLKRHANDVIALAQTRAHATVRKRHRADSVVSAEGATPKYGNRTMLIVYYDSYVQSFFEELVKFVSASRNMMRKAKMAAKVAHIRRLAELEMPDEDEGRKSREDANKAPEAAKLGPDAPLEAASTSSKSNDDDLPPLRYISTRQMRPLSRAPGAMGPGKQMYPRTATRAAHTGGGGAPDQVPDIYDELDRNLEYVQSTCEHAAHQFLRAGECTEEINNIQRKLREAKAIADKEMARVLKEDPDALKPSDEPTKMRSFRPHSMRKEGAAMSTSPKDAGPGPLEVDEGIDDMESELPKLVYKSTRLMRAPR